MATHCYARRGRRVARVSRWIQSLASGVEDWIEPPGPPRVPITRMAGVYERYMAEYVLGYLLEGTQEMARARKAQTARDWNLFEKRLARRKDDRDRRHRPCRSTVGRYARTFGMTVWGLCRERSARTPDECFERLFERRDRDAFLGGLDVLVLALPLTPSTTGIIDATALEALPPRALLINIARGGLVDEQQLIRALQQGEVAGAVLDTFEVEPLPRESPLWELPNVTITPHNAGAVHAHEVAAVCARNLREFVAGRLPDPLVDMARGY